VLQWWHQECADWINSFVSDSLKMLSRDMRNKADIGEDDVEDHVGSRCGFC
jgi:hypothetical protein